MAQTAHAISGERLPQPHGTTQSACRAQTSLLMPPVEHERGSVCSVAEPWQHKLVFAVLKPARGIMSLPLASRIPPMAWSTRGEEGAGGHMLKVSGLLKQRFQGQMLGHACSWCQHTSCRFSAGSTSLLTFHWLCACGAYAAVIRNVPQSCKWPCGLMDKALVFGTTDCRFESCQGHPAQPALRVKSWFCSSTEAALS